MVSPVTTRFFPATFHGFSLFCISLPKSLSVGARQKLISRSSARKSFPFDVYEVTGEDVHLFSYPFGAHNSALHQKAREVGYRRVFTSDPTYAFQSAQEFVTGRVSVEPNDWACEFRLKIAGAYRWGSWFQSAKKTLLSCFSK